MFRTGYYRLPRNMNPNPLIVKGAKTLLPNPQFLSIKMYEIIVPDCHVLTWEEQRFVWSQQVNSHDLKLKYASWHYPTFSKHCAANTKMIIIFSATSCKIATTIKIVRVKYNCLINYYLHDKNCTDNFWCYNK